MRRFVIVGSGLAGHRAALELRKLDATSSITLIGAEPGLPYDRPPLTKEFLLGRISVEDVVLKGARDYAENAISVLFGTPVTEIDREGRRVSTGDGQRFAFDRLLLATGSRPRRLGAVEPSERVRYVRTLDDAVELRRHLTAGGRIVIVGGGFIGLEVAAAARSRGCAVTIVEAEARLLSRGVPEQVSTFARVLHQSHGVEILLGHSVETVEDSAGEPARVMVPGRTLEADYVVIGIGVCPNTDLAEQAGLDVADGIRVDARCRTSDPEIFAAGEVTAHPTGGSGPVRRIESWRIAAEQPRVAAAGMAGHEATFDDPPWLWSDQYGMNIQVLGLPAEGTRCLVNNDAADDRWTLVALDHAGAPIGGVAVNSGRHISMLRRAMTRGEGLPEAMAETFIPVSGELPFIR